MDLCRFSASSSETFSACSIDQRVRVTISDCRFDKNRATKFIANGLRVDRLVLNLNEPSRTSSFAPSLDNSPVPSKSTLEVSCLVVQVVQRRSSLC